MKKYFYLLSAAICMFFCTSSIGQNTQIRGFSATTASYQQNKLSFGFTEQNFLVTSDLNDRLSFLGETIVRYDDHSKGTKFGIEVQRVILKYNLYGNHNILIGRQNTPINYWNDTYHHGKLFYPTIYRPFVFIANILPIHTTGIRLQGHDLGKLKFGYDLMIGNGLGSNAVEDNDKNKSITIAAHIKPAENLRIGGSYYYDIISKGAVVQQHANDQERHEDRIVDWRIVQNLFTGSVAYFGKKFEILCESTLAVNRSDTTCYKKTLGSYLYAGYKVTEKIIPYLRVDKVNFRNGEIFYIKDNISSLIAGMAYHINYLANVKLEYQYLQSEVKGNISKISAQIAVGF